ncbi:hypothetical protein [Actinoplanes xinjiangensis]|uniref:Uncharacterized protein n=2 Tax=Actinoplanes xinjiangensis TaxID=512350 RepID=A0A316EUX2_9ACTN|nr:hypothetical protein [Actinoplanes xinjiangensis]PWK36026.1 hypothetical protein BC793_1247 [Actinoplanes xinjiangensis]GIF42976.1 hypothetical protein Axi01nite_72870 [Actinoplanes xinjiangensis]
MADRPPLSGWSPGLDGDVALRDAYAGMPGDPALAIPWYVRALENPASPLALPGAIDLFGHDCIHIVLGRGMLPQDEAFVIGVTMGASGTLTRWQEVLYQWCSRLVYRGPYHLTGFDCRVFALAADFGRRSGIRPLHQVAWADWQDRSVAEVRAHVGLTVDALLGAFDRERALRPDTPAARRLPHGGAVQRR